MKHYRWLDMKHYRWLAFPMGVVGALLVLQGWMAMLLGFAYGTLCMAYAYGTIAEQDDRWAEEELHRLLDEETGR